ncbi:hypothetical protein RJT34_02555 [Clitoria ternatea]|uniref:Uncharacterized protein n=1 Tax=Clitoria ternatea TaxID=43366 RepID=A0AAN9KKM1_CLITE
MNLASIVISVLPSFIYSSVSCVNIIIRGVNGGNGSRCSSRMKGNGGLGGLRMRAILILFSGSHALETKEHKKS